MKYACAFAPKKENNLRIIRKIDINNIIVKLQQGKLMKKLNEEQVTEIIKILKQQSSQEQIAKLYGVSQQRISAIWKKYMENKQND
ncbi:hypothetical protein E4L95_16600 [Paracoccus liaowanqingii]|uniref:Uncharacterized protein n=1 Tax=Paracoccus liaowanqingii TaxID=2560053 RepID=A0A4Z1C6I9_9RHOB|nr:hypothetical protein [Paracoccus liaowanqingii]TGN51828.1 hypothetical protein E4L95_16600 [Paracoccus liaowanqingii]